MTLAIDITLARGEFSLQVSTELPTQGIAAICGASASGKTTLLRCIAGLEGFSGSLQFRHEIWQQPTTKPLPPERRGVGCVFQDNRLFPHLTVEANLRYAFARRFSDAGPGVRSAAQQLAVEHLLTRDIHSLSGGELRRVAIARALCSAPRLLLLDEPLTGLDAAARHHLVEIIIDQQRNSGIPMLYVGHDFAEISRLADQVLVLGNGRVLHQGPAIELSADLEFVAQHESEAAAIVSARVGDQDAEFSLTNLLLDDAHNLWLTHIDAPAGTRLNLRIPAKDVSITREPGISSILNSLPCVIDSIAPLTTAHVLLRLAVGEQFLLARITRKSAHNLQLKTGETVFAQIKSAALLGEAGAL